MNDFQTPRPLNILRGIVPVASIWDTDPTNLERCTDGDLATVTGTGDKVMAGAGNIGYLVFDLGSIKTVLIGSKLGTWATAGGPTLSIEISDDGISYSLPGRDNVSITTSTEKINYCISIIGCGRYIRFRFFVTTASTAYVKIYEIMGWELQL